MLKSLYDEFKSSDALRDDDDFEIAMEKVHNPLINRYLKLGKRHKRGKRGRGRKRRRIKKRRQRKRKRKRRRTPRRRRRRRKRGRSALRRRWRARLRRARSRRLRRYRRMKRRLRRYRRFWNQFRNFNGRYKRWYTKLYRKWYYKHFLPKWNKQKDIEIGKHQVKSMKDAITALNHGINAIERKHMKQGSPKKEKEKSLRKRDVWKLFAKMDHDGEYLHYNEEAHG